MPKVQLGDLIVPNQALSRYDLFENSFLNTISTKQCRGFGLNPKSKIFEALFIDKTFNHFTPFIVVDIVREVSDGYVIDVLYDGIVYRTWSDNFILISARGNSDDNIR